MKHLLSFASVLSLVVLGNAHATDLEQPESNVYAPHFLLGVGFTFGGDTLATASYTDGSTDKVTAGGGLLIHGGVDYQVNDKFTLQATVGYHFDTTKAASNGGITFSRVPLELLGYFNANDKFRIGGGMRMTTSPKLKGTGPGSGINASFDNALGLLIEGEYLVSQKVGIKLRHVSEHYRISGSQTTVGGSHVGILANFYF